MSVYEELGEQKTVKLNQGEVSYRETGQGQPIVFIHGLLVNGDVWRKVVPDLAKGYRCITPDLPLGSHRIPLNANADLTPPGVAHLIANFIEALDLLDVTLVGVDTGGALSQLVIANHPERIGRLILNNCDCFENFFPGLLAPLQYSAFIPGFIWSLGRLGKWPPFQKLLLGLVTKYRVEKRAVNSYVGMLGQNREVRRDLGKVMRGISNRYTLAAAKTFGQFEKPVLIVWGKQDFLFPIRYAKRLAQAFPNSRLEFVDNSRTFISEDQPARLIELMQGFLASLESSPLK